MAEIISAGLLEAGDVFRLGRSASGMARVYEVQLDGIRRQRTTGDNVIIAATRVGTDGGHRADMALLASTPVEKLERLGERDVRDALACLEPGDEITVVRWGMGFWA